MAVYKDVIREALDIYGIEHQTRMFAEEAAELFVELNKVLRGRVDCNVNNVAEELADVQIVIDQLTEYYDAAETVKEFKLLKIRRLAFRLGFTEEVTE